jgi:hypothetical protein
LERSSQEQSPGIRCAIVCLTPESIRSVWVAFEAGAISRAAGGPDGARLRIWTYLSALRPQDLQLTPFAEYEATDATQEETFRLVRSINQLSPDPVSGDSLKGRFDAVFWPNFSKVLDQARALVEAIPSATTDLRSSQPEVLEEILRTLRAVQREVSRPLSTAFSGISSLRTTPSDVLMRLLSCDAPSRSPPARLLHQGYEGPLFIDNPLRDPPVHVRQTRAPSLPNALWTTVPLPPPGQCKRYRLRGRPSRNLLGQPSRYRPVVAVIVRGPIRSS